MQEREARCGGGKFFGFIKGADGIESSFDESCVMKGSAPAIGDGVFAVSHVSALSVERPRDRGRRLLCAVRGSGRKNKSDPHADHKEQGNNGSNACLNRRQAFEKMRNEQVLRVFCCGCARMERSGTCGPVHFALLRRRRP